MVGGGDGSDGCNGGGTLSSVLTLGLSFSRKSGKFITSPLLTTSSLFPGDIVGLVVFRVFVAVVVMLLALLVLVYLYFAFFSFIGLFYYLWPSSLFCDHNKI